MKIAGWSLSLLLALASPAAVGCAGGKKGPEIASSSGEAAYAVSYPTELTSAMSTFDDRQKEARKLAQGFAQYPDQVSGANRTQVLAIVDAADQAGRGQAYVDRAREGDRVSAFFDAEKDELNKKVGGAAQFAAKQKGCNADVYGATSHALKEAVDKQLEKRLRERNEAHQIIERYRVTLGKQNAPALEKQADEISRASFYVSIDLVDRRNRVQQMAEEGDRIKRTADDAIAKEKTFQAEPGRTPEEKKASDDRMAAMSKAKASVDGAVNQAKQQLPEMDKQLKAAQQEYAQALDNLRSKLKK